ncbi:MAG TPA: hypothetical protein PK718_02795 [Candidatus Methanofastidiosa archaeon]|nr:hypothetical protein [Candidatus Methanofastidiosa archaeon]
MGIKRILVSKDDARLQPLAGLVERQKHRTLVLWTIDCADRYLPIFEKDHPQDQRPGKAVKAAEAWARGEIKMPLAKKAAHSAHNAATEVSEDAAACAAARAMGHVVGTVHVATHAMGFVIYAITSMIYATGNPNDAGDIIEKECEWLYQRLQYWEANVDKTDTTWAAFLLRD